MTAQSWQSPKSELRGVWLTCYVGDWPSPSNKGTSLSAIQGQKDELKALFDAYKGMGLNSVFFHVRINGDAVYKSKYEPWSQYLMGSSGAAPEDPSYDPLKFAIEEAHKRGLELHAWFNPYRVVPSGGSTANLAANHPAKKHPELLITTSNNYMFLDPGLPAARSYIADVIMDVVRNYNIDGVHMDDYFYAYPEYGTYNDDVTFNNYKNGFTDRAAWRKNNINMLMAALNDSINAVKPYVKFGISPSGLDNVNNSIYCDAYSWLKGTYTDDKGIARTGPPYVDYIMPQLYGERYQGTLGSWAKADVLNGRHLYIGQPAYLYPQWSAANITFEHMMNRTNQYISGGVYFSSKSIIGNFKGIIDSLKNHYNVFPSILPGMTWKPKSNTKPNAPQNLRIQKTASGVPLLVWDKSAAAADGDTAIFYAVYRGTQSAVNVNEAGTLMGFTGLTTLDDRWARYAVTKGNYYVVTALDRYSNESAPSAAVYADPALYPQTAPQPRVPANGDNNQQSSVVLRWSKTPQGQSYTMQISRSPAFNDTTLLTCPDIKDTLFTVNGIPAQKDYYWRVKSHGIGGESSWSQTFSFRAGYPVTPELISPAHAATNLPLKPVFKWVKQGSSTYRIQIATGSTFTTGLVTDLTVSDSFYVMSKDLDANKVYYWHIMATNSLGQSDWSKTNGFKTGDGTSAVSEGSVAKVYELRQNYPNPFNPSTRISYSTAKEGVVKIRLFNIVGQQIAVLMEEFRPAGNYSLEFDAQQYSLPSGIYYYIMSTDGYTASRKMILLK